MDDKREKDEGQKSRPRILTNPDVDVANWLALPVEEFMQLLVHDIRHELQNLHTMVDIVNSDSVSPTVKLPSFNNEYTIKDVCELLLRCEARMENAVNVAAEYGKHMRSK